MTLKLNGSSSGSVSIDAPASTAGGADRTLTLPDDAGNGVIKTSTYPSSLQVLERFLTPCDGSTITRSNGDSSNSKVKLIASARFGVKIEYLNNCREIEIKIAQGAKPGEGGQLPGFKVSKEIAKLRHTTPAVT